MIQRNIYIYIYNVGQIGEKKQTLGQNKLWGSIIQTYRSMQTISQKIESSLGE